MKRTFSKEFKLKACELVLKDGIKHKVVAEKLGINHIMLYRWIDDYQTYGDDAFVFPSHAQTRQMRNLDAEGQLDYESIKEIMSELKPNQVEKLKIPIDCIRQYAPRGATPKDMEELLIRLAKENYQRQCRMRDDDAR